MTDALFRCCSRRPRHRALKPRRKDEVPLTGVARFISQDKHLANSNGELDIRRSPEIVVVNSVSPRFQARVSAPSLSDVSREVNLTTLHSLPGREYPPERGASGDRQTDRTATARQRNPLRWSMPATSIAIHSTSDSWRAPSVAYSLRGGKIASLPSSHRRERRLIRRNNAGDKPHENRQLGTSTGLRTCNTRGTRVRTY